MDYKKFKNYKGIEYMATFYNGILHSYNDKPAIIWNDKLNTKEWYNFGLRHRSNNNPAYENKILKEWWYNDKKIKIKYLN